MDEGLYFELRVEVLQEGRMERLNLRLAVLFTGAVTITKKALTCLKGSRTRTE